MFPKYHFIQKQILTKFMKKFEIIGKIPSKTAGDFQLPVLGFGTYGIGGYDHQGLNSEERRDISTICDAIDSGLTHIDTAEGYADGRTEILIGKAIKKYDRSHLFITSKVRRKNLGYNDVIRAVKGSLRRMDLNYLDLCLIHAPNQFIPIKETMKAFDYLYENGLIKNIGVSNFDVPLLREAMVSTKYKIKNNQLHYGLTAREYENNGTLEFCRQNNILVTAYRVLGYGQKFADFSVLKELSLKYGKTSAQIALNWLNYQPNTVTLVKSSNKEHLLENLSSFDWSMDKNDYDRLTSGFPRGETINLPRSKAEK